MERDDVASVMAICMVSEQRAVELLEAASGSLQRAIDIHLQQNPRSGAIKGREVVDITGDDNENCVVDEAESPPAKKRRENSSPKSSTPKTNGNPTSPHTPRSSSSNNSKQKKIHSFFGVGTNSSSGALTKKTEEGSGETRQEKSKLTDSKLKIPKELTQSAVSEKATSTGGGKLLAQKRPLDASKTKTEPKVVDPRTNYSTLAKAFGQMTNTTKRNEKLNILKSILIDVIQAAGGIHCSSGGDIESRAEDARILISTLELISGTISLGETVAPAPLQVSGAAVSSAIQVITGVSKNRLREAYRRTGDLGDAAAEFYDPAQSVKNFFVSNKTSSSSKSSNESAGASVEQIHRMLRSIATVPQGTGSQKERHSLLLKLMRTSSSKEEVRFLTRTLIGNMRLGATIKSIIAALAMAAQEVETKSKVSTQDPAIQKLQKAYDICPRMDRIANALLCGGVECAVENCSISVGIPIQPMLANPAHSLAEVEAFMTKKNPGSCSTIAEWKYDGMRCQAHFDGTNVTLFSRHLHDSTAQFPDAVTHMIKARSSDSIQSFIIDAEIVAVAPCKNAGDREDSFRLLPFQILSTRRGTKATDSSGDEARKNLQIRVYAFDLMYLNGQSLLDQPLFQRLRALRDTFRETEGFTFAASMELASFDEAKITAYLRQAVEGGAEGLMMKLTGNIESSSAGKQPRTKSNSLPPASPLCNYESGTRSQTWLKVKRDYVKQFADTIDVVPIGAWFGNGRKAEKGFLSPVLLAVYDDEDGTFLSISRCMSFTDEMYKSVREFYFHGIPFPPSLGLLDENGTKEPQETTLDEESGGESEAGEGGDDDVDNNEGQLDDNDQQDNELTDDANDRVNCFPHRPSSALYKTNETPPIWFKPLEVWEVSFADLTRSRVHTAAAGLVNDNDTEGRGVAMRFPRFIRRRPDKNVEQATTSAQIAQLFGKQFKQA